METIEYSKIRVLFMDIGGVLLTNGWGHESREKAAKVFGFDYNEMNILHNFIYDVFEIGSITLDDYLNTILFYSPRNFSKHEIINFMYAQSEELPEMLAWLKIWKRHLNLPVFALSNESRELNDYRVKSVGLHKLFDGFISSCNVGFRKPDPRIFQKAMHIAQLAPAECIYFDDRAMLVNAAKKLGIIGIQHENFEDTKKIIENFILK